MTRRRRTPPKRSRWPTALATCRRRRAPAATSASRALVTSPRGARADLDRAAELARTAGDDWAFVAAKQWTACSYLFEFEHARAARANDEVAALAERVGDPANVGRRWLWNVWMAVHDGRLSEARDAADRARAAWKGVGSPTQVGARRVRPRGGRDPAGGARAGARASADRARSRDQGRRRVLWCRTCSKGSPRPSSQPVNSRLPAAGSRALMQVLRGRDSFITWRALGLLAEAQRLSGDAAAEATAREAQTESERFGNRFLGTLAGLTRARLAAARGDWTTAQQHTRAHLDVCAHGGHLTYIPACFDALGELAEGCGEHADAARLFAAAQRTRERSSAPYAFRVRTSTGRRSIAGCETRSATRHTRPPRTRRRFEHRGRARVGAPRPRPAPAPAQRLAIAHSDRGQSRRVRRPRAHQPARSPSACSSRRKPSRRTCRTSSASSTSIAVPS